MFVFFCLASCCLFFFPSLCPSLPFYPQICQIPLICHLPRGKYAASSSGFDGSALVTGTCGALLTAWVYSIHIAAGCRIAVRPDVKPSIAMPLHWSDTAGLTPRRQRA